MHSNIRPVISFAIARIVCLATALFVLPAAAGTNSWTAIGPVAYPFAVDPSLPSTIYSVVNGNTVTKTTDGGEHWADLTVFAFDSVNSLVIDPQSPGTIYAALGTPWDGAAVPIYRSVDGGAHWAAEAADFNYLPALAVAIAPSLSSTLYAGATDAVFKSIDGGLSWAPRRNGLTGFVVLALAIDPTNADVVYVAQQVAGFTGPDTGKIFKSTDGGVQWRQVPISVPAGAAIWSLAIDPATPSIVYAAFASPNAGKGGILKSIDGGETWIAAQNGLPDTIFVNALAIDPSAPARIYAATDQGVFRSSDAAASWTPINSGLTNLHVWSLSIDRTGSLLRAATAAGLFEYQPTTQGAGIDLLQRGLTGAWYDPRTSGQGFMVVVIPDISSPEKGIVQGSWLTYDNVVGGAEHQRWYTLSGPVVSGQTVVSMTIYQNTGGNFNAPPRTTGLPVGTATLSFDSCTSGQLVYNFTDGSGRASTIPLTRMMQNVTCSVTSDPLTNFYLALSGILYNGGSTHPPSTEGQGLSVEVNPVSSALFFAWMTYAPNGAGAGPAGQRWYTGLGTIVPRSTRAPVQLYETTGGLFDDGTASPTTLVVGSGVLLFSNCGNWLTFDFTGGSSSGASGMIFLDHIPEYSSGEGCWDY